MYKTNRRLEYIRSTLLMIVSEKGQHHMWHIIRVLSLVGINGDCFEAAAWDAGRKARNRRAHALNGNTRKRKNNTGGPDTGTLPGGSSSGDPANQPGQASGLDRPDSRQGGPGQRRYMPKARPPPARPQEHQNGDRNGSPKEEQKDVKRRSLGEHPSQESCASAASGRGSGAGEKVRDRPEAAGGGEGPTDGDPNAAAAVGPSLPRPVGPGGDGRRSY